MPGMRFGVDFIGKSTDKKVAESCKKLQKIAWELSSFKFRIPIEFEDV
jgi:hypothetical protein